MTREEAIKILMDGELNPCVDEDREACDMAIKALEQEPILDKIGVDLDLVLKASQFAVYRYIEEGSKMFATGISTDDCKMIDWVDVINALAELREAIQ